MLVSCDFSKLKSVQSVKSLGEKLSNPEEIENFIVQIFESGIYGRKHPVLYIVYPQA